MRFQIPFIVSFIVLQWAPSSVVYAAEADVLNARQRELRKMLIPSGRPPSYEWIATNHMERFGVSLREFTHDLRSIAENEQEERRIRAHAFSQYSRFATDAEILDLPYYFDERFDKDLRQSFINRALGGIDSLENRLSFAKRLVSAEDRIAAEEVRRTAPDVLIEPAVGDILTMDFSRATDAIQAGRDAAEAALG